MNRDRNKFMDLYYETQHKIKDTYYNTKWFFKNIWTFRQTLKYARPYDYSGLFYALEDQLTQQIDCGMPHILGGERHIKNMKIARHLIKRIVEDEYVLDKVDYSKIRFELIDEGSRQYRVNVESTQLHDLPTTDLAMKIDYRKQDLDLLTKMLNKHILSWWD